MAITYSLAPLPKWIIIDNQGTTAGGAQLFTYSSINKSEKKPVYQDPGGTLPYTNPVIFDANGTQGPLYWKFDSDTPDELYYLRVYDADGNFLWDIDDFSGGAGGGGGNVTNYLTINNLIANNVFIDHIDDTANPINSQNLLICPSNHHGFTPDLINPVVGTSGVVGPDIRFVKNNTAATDQITFDSFFGVNPLTGDVTPVEYLRYECTNSPIGETYKAFQFPICQKVQNLSNTSVTFTVWAKVEITPVNLTVYYRQYFGSGPSASPEVRSAVGTIALTSTWQSFVFNFTVPTVAGKTLGECGDDAFYMQLEMPLGAPCNVCFTKPALYVGDIDPDIDFESYDQIDSVIQTPRTGDLKYSYRSSAGIGWVPMNNGTIGSAASTATTRKNIDTFPLFKTLWDGVNDHFAPVSGGRGASAVDDFKDNKTIQLTPSLGRVMMGQNADFSTSLTFTADAATDLLTVSSTTNLPTGAPVLVSNTGGALPSPLIPNAIYYVINQSATTLKLAFTEEYALNNTPIDITTAGSGTNTVTTALGATIGEGLHTLTIAEMPSHTHSTIVTEVPTAHELSGPGGTRIIASPSVTGSTGGGDPHNNMQPTVISNIFIKL